MSQAFSLKAETRVNGEIKICFSKIKELIERLKKKRETFCDCYLDLITAFKKDHRKNNQTGEITFYFRDRICIFLKKEDYYISETNFSNYE
jgi:phage host-nuclease inhibitor protein Gam